MPQITLRVKGAKVVRKGLENLRTKWPLVSRQRLYDAAREIVRRMKKPGKNITYPVQWDSDKQRRAYFATDGFGHGIPYTRTGKHQAGWKVLKTKAGDYIAVNKSLVAKYISGGADGLGQSKIHEGRWTLLRDAVDIVVRRLPKAVRNSLAIVARREKLKVIE